MMNSVTRFLSKLVSGEKSSEPDGVQPENISSGELAFLSRDRPLIDQLYKLTYVPTIYGSMEISPEETDNIIERASNPDPQAETEWRAIIRSALETDRFNGTHLRSILLEHLGKSDFKEFLPLLQDLRRRYRHEERRDVLFLADLNKAIHELSGDSAIVEEEAEVLRTCLQEECDQGGLYVAVSTMRFIGSPEHIDLLVPFLGSSRPNLRVNTIMDAIRGIGYRHNPGRVNLTFGGDDLDPKTCLAQFVSIVEYQSFTPRGDLNPLWLQPEIDLVCEFVHSEDTVMRVLALLALRSIPGNREYKEEKNRHYLDDRLKANDLPGEERYAIRLYNMSIEYPIA